MKLYRPSNRLLSHVPFFVLCMAFAAPAMAQEEEPADSTEVEADEEDDPFEEIVEDATFREGFFNTYEKDGHLYLVVPEDRLNEDFLLSFQIAQGIGANRLNGGTMLSIFEPKIVAFEEHHGRIYLVQRPHRFVAPQDSPESRAVQLSFGSSVLESAEIEAKDPDSSRVIDVYDWLVSDLSGVSARVRRAVSSESDGSASIDEDRSYLDEVLAFPDNLSITAKLTFKPGRPTSMRSVPDSRFIPLGIHYTLARLPRTPMEPRLGDDRVGFFLNVHKDFSLDENDNFFVRYINKWRLECSSSTRGGLCEPVEPIIYYIDHTVPEEYRETMMEGVEAFNEAFEAAGFRNAIRAEMLPHDADPADIRFATLRWNTSDQPGYGAIGPSIVDPRTGEILDADILFEANMIAGFRRSWRTLVDPVTALEQMLGTDGESTPAVMGTELEGFGAEFAMQGSLIRILLTARGDLQPGEPVPMEFVLEALKWVTMHEIGHTLGLRHNFRSSMDTPNDRLHDTRWTGEHGVFGSVMEYPTPNIAASGRNGHYYNTGMGSYDRWAISYGYTPNANRAAEIARQAAQPGHAYGTDEDARGANAIDPTVNVYDLGDDPLAWGMERADLIRAAWVRIPQYALQDNSAYSEATADFAALLVQYVRAISVGVKYIGGQYQYRDHVGDPAGRDPFVMVPRARQLEALDFIVRYAFAPDAFVLPEEVLQSFGANRWSHWGNTNTVDGRIDYPYHDLVLGAQSSLLNRLTSASVFSRIRDGELKFGNGVLSVPELLHALTAAIWSEFDNTDDPNISAMRRDLQRAYLDRMSAIITDSPDGMPADGRSVARMILVELAGRVRTHLEASADSLDDYSSAHLQEIQVRISRTLDAGMELEN